jgi:hypothetical protein
MCNDDSENEGGDAASRADDTSDGYTVGYGKPPNTTASQVCTRTSGG